MQRIADCSRTLKVLPCREQPGWLSFFCNHARPRWQFRVALPARKNDPTHAVQPGAGDQSRQICCWNGGSRSGRGNRVRQAITPASPPHRPSNRVAGRSPQPLKVRRIVAAQQSPMAYHLKGHTPSRSRQFDRESATTRTGVNPELVSDAGRNLADGARRQRCETATPQGNSPTCIVSITLSAATSITETSFERPLVVKRYFSSGVNAMCHTRCPTSRYFLT
jgi:hypothetical protein